MIDASKPHSILVNVISHQLDHISPSLPDCLSLPHLTETGQNWPSLITSQSSQENSNYHHSLSAGQKCWWIQDPPNFPRWTHMFFSSSPSWFSWLYQHHCHWNFFPAQPSQAPLLKEFWFWVTFVWNRSNCTKQSKAKQQRCLIW